MSPKNVASPTGPLLIGDSVKSYKFQSDRFILNNDAVASLLGQTSALAIQTDAACKQLLSIDPNISKYYIGICKLTLKLASSWISSTNALIKCFRPEWASVGVFPVSEGWWSINKKWKCTQPNWMGETRKTSVSYVKARRKWLEQVGLRHHWDYDETKGKFGHLEKKEGNEVNSSYYWVWRDFFQVSKKLDSPSL